MVQSESANSTDLHVRFAFVQDNFVQAGGGERVAEEIARVLPEADVYTSVLVQDRLSPYMKLRKIHTTWMQKLPMMKKYYRHYFLLYPLAIRGISLKNYDVVISSCYGFAKTLRKPADAVHVCYCHTPTRWIWRYDDYARRENFSAPTRFILSNLVRLLKRADRAAADRTDIFIANSSAVAERIRTCYEREAQVIFPPIDCSRFFLSSDIGDYYLVVSRLVPYKRIDLAIEACNLSGRKLIVIGDGPDRRRLEALAGATITFLGRVSDDEVAKYLSHCRAFLFPGEEDFGMTPLEANASGRPSIAYGRGGALDTIDDGVSGVLFPKPTAASLSEAMLRSEEIEWDGATLRAHAQRFDRSVFAKQLTKLLSNVCASLETSRGRATTSERAWESVAAGHTKL